MPIVFTNDEIMLDDGSKVKIGAKHHSARDLVRAIVKAVYQREIATDKTGAQAEMETALLTGYETQSSVGKIVRQ